ncbi:MAG TPA: efflux RND transporter periplasmic adaptor subunit, partial [Opitutaceae bacterium]|nr:efflux RND transporter periplasmic adaptor subunit [Opitutaceae bacterium]
QPTDRSLRLRLPLVTTALFAAVLLVTGCSKHAAAPADAARTVLVQRAVAGSASSTAEAWNGSVRSPDRATLAFAVGGRLAKTFVEIGDRVEAGAVLAELDQEPFALELAQAEAQAQAAGPALEEATRRLEAEEQLRSSGATSRADFDAAASAFAAARSQKQAADAALGLARRQQRESRLLAPCAGRIAQRLLSNATVLAAGTPVLEFDSEGPAEVVVALPASRVGSLVVDQRVHVAAHLATAQPLQLEGRIAHIGQRSLGGSVHEVIVRLPADAAVFPGEAVVVELLAPTEPAGVTLPLTAIQPAAEVGSGHVFLFDTQAQRLTQRVVRYRTPHGAAAIVTAGVRPGDLVVVAGLPFLRDGQSARAQLRE